MALKFIPQCMSHIAIVKIYNQFFFCLVAYLVLYRDKTNSKNYNWKSASKLPVTADYSYGLCLEIYKILSAFDVDLIFQFFKKMKYQQYSTHFILQVQYGKFFDWLY